MANWDDGYVTDVPYVAGFHNELTPVWIAAVAALTGFDAPDLVRPFRYADLGCGNGVTALVTAATNPHAEIWAFDFNPAHVEAGRDVARRAELANIQFVEASFEDLACRPKHTLPTFEYIAAHGVLSWISLENRRRLFAVMGQRLAAGGIGYISYNVATGWAGMRPVRTLMRLLAEASPERTDVAAAGIFATLEKMKDAGAALFQTHPALEANLAMFRGQNQQYVAHELLNRDWHPVMFHAVAAAMAEVKCDYICSATPHDNIAALTVPAALRELFVQARGTYLRETLRDIGCAAGIRRDLYQRGPRRLTATEHLARLDALGLARTFKPVPEPIVLPSAFGQITPDQQRCRALLARLESGPATISTIRREPALADWAVAQLLELVTHLLGAGYLAPVLKNPPADSAVAATARLNTVLAELLAQGREQQYVAYPALGVAWHTKDLEILALDALRGGVAAEETTLIDAVMNRLARSGRGLLQKGAFVTDPAVGREIVAKEVRDLLQNRLSAIRGLGVIPGEPIDAVAGSMAP